MGEFLQDIKNAVKNKGGRLAYPESTEPRILQAINQVLKDGLVSELFVFSPQKEWLAAAKSLGLGELGRPHPRLVFVPEGYPIDRQDLLLFLRGVMKDKPMSEQALAEMADSALYQAGFLLHKGVVDGVLAGAITETAHVIRTALRTVGKAPGIQTISGSFLMERGDEVYLFADCGVNIEPSLDELVDIALESKKTWEAIPFLKKRPMGMAFLSFSTKGSAKHKSCTKMAEAARMVHERDASLSVDGELQFDAAIDLEIGRRKAPGLLVPDLPSSPRCMHSAEAVFA